MGCCIQKAKCKNRPNDPARKLSAKSRPIEFPKDPASSVVLLAVGCENRAKDTDNQIRQHRREIPH